MEPIVSKARKLRQSGQHEESVALLQHHLAAGPGHATVEMELACVQDYLGHSRAAIASYRRALAAGLAGNELRSAYLGLGSSLRAVGDYAEALAVFDEGQKRFPAAREIAVFRAMVLYNLGQSKEAMRICLRQLAQTSKDKEISSLRRPILDYARNLDRTWT